MVWFKGAHLIGAPFSSLILFTQVLSKAMKILKLLFCFLILLIAVSCKKETAVPEQFSFVQIQVNDKVGGSSFNNLNPTPTVKLQFSAPVDRNSVNKSIQLNGTSSAHPYSVSYERSDSVIVIIPSTPLDYASKYSLVILYTLVSKQQTLIDSEHNFSLITSIDTTDKFPRITDNQLLTLIQQQTFKYFYDFAHPSCGMARERNSSGDIVTTGGSGFGIMALIVGMERGFISRADGIARLSKILNFLSTCDRFHGAWPHWMNGSTGKVVPFTTQDNGGDLVETSFMAEGLITMRQYLNASDPAEKTLIDKINTLCNAIEYDWYTQNQNVLYWHWSPNYGWAMNMQLQGYNETLIAYIMAASSPEHTITRDTYKNGYARNGGIKNGKQFYGITLPLGQDYGGPLFFTHYSFLGLDPRKLSDEFANYWQQNVNHSLINYSYCVANPRQYYGYNADCWGLTASDIPGGYTASSPTNDVGVIAPTAAISALPYTPIESMKAIRFFYYKLGDKTWKQYGFVDSFALYDFWFADSFLAIDQGPEISMIENYRTGLLWDLFMSAPEVKTGLTKLGFSYK